MKTMLETHRRYRGFSLGEMLAALVIGAMVLTSILGLYGRATRASEAVAKKIDSPALGSEVLQLITEDIDRMTEGPDCVIEMKNGFDNGYATAQLTMRRTYYDGENKEQTFDEITWQTGYDYDGGGDGLVVYRSYSGKTPEDRLLESQREDWEANYPLVPICRGVTFFRIEVTNGETSTDNWSGAYLPPGLDISLSFAAPFQTVQGTLDVEETEKTHRILAVNRNRIIRFTTTSPEENSTNDGQPLQQSER